MACIAVIDTETNWENRVMSLGVVLGDRENFRPVDARYYIFCPEWETGGMYDGVLDLAPVDKTRYAARAAAMQDLNRWLHSRGAEEIYAYNARFDCRHLPELEDFAWYDIMGLAAYRQYNPAIPADALCCRTGRLRSRYGVEPILQLLSGDSGYRETHNAYYDALDELKIMSLLGCPAEIYSCTRINP